MVESPVAGESSDGAHRNGQAMNQAQSEYTIGMLSRRSGVPVKTIRYYSDEGLLPPARVTDAGYRYYRDEELNRLATIRTLKAAGFDLTTIRRLLDEELDPTRAARLQVEALWTQERQARRQRLLLERAVAHGDLARYPERLHALGLLSAREREAFLAVHLDAGMDGIPADPAWRARFIDAAVRDLPEDLSDEQLDAWGELAAMVADPTFAEAMQRAGRPFWSAVAERGSYDAAAFQAAQQRIIDGAKAAIRRGDAPESPAARSLVDAWLELSATVMGRTNDAAFARWMHARGQEHDPRLSRYWDLVAILKGWAIDRELNAAWTWLVAALAFRVGEPAAG